MAGLLDAWIASGRLVDLILGAMLLEGVGLLAYRWRTGGGIPATGLLINLAAGASLLLALRAALVGQMVLVPACLVAALVAHLVDLAVRWRAAVAPVSPRQPRH